MRCHGCNGKGWVDSTKRGPVKCIICYGTGQVKEPLAEAD